MIDKKSLENSVGIAQKLTAAGVVLDTLDQTAMKHVIGSLSMMSTSPQSDDEACVLLKNAAQHVEHDGTMLHTANNAANSVLNTHRLVTNVVNPHIRKVVAEITSRLADVAGNISDTGHTVELVSLPSVLDNPDVEAMIRHTADMDRYDADVIDLGKYSESEILDLIRYSTSGNFDDVLKMELVNTGGYVEAINRVLAGQFTDVSKTPTEVALAIFLMASSLKHTETIKEGINASLSDYRNRLNYIAITYARHLDAVYSAWNKISTSKLIYRPDVVGKVAVISSVFNDLATNHGVTIENILGNDLLDRRYTYVDFTGENKDEVLAKTRSAYDRDLSAKNLGKEDRENDLTLRTALIAIKDDAIERAESDENLSILGDTKATMISRATAACEAVFKTGKILKKDQLDEFTAGLLIAIYYAHTDALLYLDKITDFSKQYPDMGGVELAKLARTSLVVHWVHSQLATVAK